MLSRYETIYFRGCIDFCNYQCSYCPFAKKGFDAKKLTADRQALEQLITAVAASQGNGKTVMLLPYGEGLIHQHTMEGLAKLSALPQVAAVGIQTNASFSVTALLDAFSNNAGVLSKLRLWCSFHPSEVSLEMFLKTCRQLQHAGILFSVGAVAEIPNRELLAQLRQQLDPCVYLWLNAKAHARPYQADDRAFFEQIDPFFVLETSRIAAEFSACTGGKSSVFIGASGKLAACPICRTTANAGAAFHCGQKRCSCFLAYSNRTDLPLLDALGSYRRTRVPNHQTRTLVFFDIDGTLLDKEGRIPSFLAPLLELYQDRFLFFFNTALPFEHAKRRISPIWKLFAGGSFSNGADIRVFSSGYQRILPLPSLKDTPPLAQRAILHQEQGIPCKLTIAANQVNAGFLSKRSGQLLVSYDQRFCYITHPLGGKYNAMVLLCRYYQVPLAQTAFLGNSENDRLAGTKAGNYYPIDEHHPLQTVLAAYFLNNGN